MYPIDFLWRAAQRWPEQPAVLSSLETITHAQLAGRVAARARQLQTSIAQPGAMVCVGGANSVEHLVAILAVLAAGKIWVPLNPRLGDEEIASIVSFVDPQAILADPAMVGRLVHDRVQPFILPESGGSGGFPKSCERNLSETQAVKFTGGTTGRPKGVCQPLRAWNTKIAMQIHELGLTASDGYVVAAPLTHGASTYVLPLLAVGGAVILPDEGGAPAILDAIERHRGTLTFAPPTLIAALTEEQAVYERELDSLRLLIYGGGPMRPEQIRRTQSIFGPVLATSYGQTEAPQILSFLHPGDMHGDAIASVGRPSLLTRIAILGDDGSELPNGEQGEIAVHGDLVMSGYLNAPDATAQVLHAGWLRTGDVGRIDAQGYLHICDRLRDVIISGGFNVFPSDVEAVIDRHADIADCSVVGIEDARWGEAVHAAITPHPERVIDRAALLADIRHALGPVKTPKAIHLFDSLPKSPVGKVLKTEIRAEIVRRLSQTEKTGGH